VVKVKKLGKLAVSGGSITFDSHTSGHRGGGGGGIVVGIEHADPFGPQNASPKAPNPSNPFGSIALTPSCNAWVLMPSKADNAAQKV